MSSKPRHSPTGGRPAAERQFVGREESIAPVHAALKEPQRTKPLVLVYYGGAGIGKSRLRRELTKQMAGDPGVLTATLDFDIPGYRQPETALLFLRNAVRETYQTEFPSFDLAYAVYWQKTHPEAPLGDDLKPLLEPGSLQSQLLDGTGKLPLIGLIPRTAALLAKSLESSTPGPLDSFLSDWWERRGSRELEDLPQMEPGAIIDRLPMLWAADLRDHLGATSREEGEERREDTKAQVQNDGRRTMDEERGTRRAVLFIDTYEGLWETGQTEADFFKRDEWARELVKQLPEALWIVCGRQKLRWEEVEPDWGKALSQHELGALPDKSARSFLESCDITNGQIQDAIVKGSQGVPHYLDLAVDTLERTKDKGRGTKLTGDSPDELVEQFTRQLDKPEVETLQVLSATRFWYYGLFENLITKYQTGYPLAGYDDLSRFSFISEGAAPGTRTMHELMREALQESQSPELRKRVHLFLHELYARQLEGLDVRNITHKHKTALTEAFYHGRRAKDAGELWAWFKTQADFFHAAGQFRLLIPLCREMVQDLDARQGPNHRSIAEALTRLASNIFLQGGCDEAEPLFRRALTMADRETGLEREDVVNCLSHLAMLLRDQALYDEAEVLCRRATGLCDKPGKSPIKKAEVLDNLAAVLIEQREYAEAEELLHRALGIYDEAPEPDSDRHADMLNTLGYLLYMQARYAEAETPYRRALAMSEKILGPNHPDVTWPMGNLASVLNCLNRYAEAESLFRRTLKISEETLGPDHPHTAMALSKFSVLLLDQGRYAESEALSRRALAAHERKMGRDHPVTLKMANRLALALAGQGNHVEAEPVVLSTLANSEKKAGPEHPETAQALHTIGILYSGQGRYAEAEGCLRRALDIRTRVLGPEHPDTLESMDAWALFEERRCKYSEAESLYRDVLATRDRVQGPGHPNVASTAGRLAGLCCRDGRYSEAEALHHRALAIREKVFGPDHPFTAETLEGLAKVCEQTGRTAEAQELTARALRIRAQSERAAAPNNPQQQA